MSTLMKEVEQGLQLVGCTGIEDKLQDGVPEVCVCVWRGGEGVEECGGLCCICGLLW